MKYITVFWAAACLTSASALIFKSPIHSIKRCLSSENYESEGRQEGNQRRWSNTPRNQHILKGGDHNQDGASAVAGVFINPVWDFNEEAQITEVSFGTPPQKLRLLVSISDSNIFIPSTTCDSVCRAQRSYNSTLSSTYHANGTRLYEHYIRGSYRGFVSEDTIHLAGLSIPSQQFGEATYFWPSPGPIYNDSRYDDRWDGYLGLSPSRNRSSYLGSPSVLENISKLGLVDKNMFSLKLSRGEDDPGELMLGGSNPDLYEGELQTLHLIDDREGIHLINGGWKVNATSMHIGSGSVSLAGYAATLESDFPGIGIREDYMVLLHKYLGMEDQGGYGWPSIDCGKRDGMEDLTITLEGKEFSIGPYEYTLEAGLEGYEERRCVSVFWPLRNPDVEWGEKYIILGSSFMRAFYGVFDLDEGTISLAKAKHLNGT